MEYSQFADIVQLIRQSRANAIKAVNTELINLYWNVGGYISLQIEQSAWGEKTVDELANFIQQQHPDLKGFNRRGLYRMKQFYEVYRNLTIVSSARTQLQSAKKQGAIIVSPDGTQFEIDDIRSTLLAQLSWTHHRTIFSRWRTEEERLFYLQLSIKENYSSKELDRQINSGTFERTMLGKTEFAAPLREVHPDIAKSFKDKYVFEFLDLQEPHNESDLQKGLIQQMKHFILELGKDFLFIGEEYKVQVGNSDFYIDLLFYHRGLQCLVALELKSDKFRPEHLGQLNFYLEALDRDVRKKHENPSIGLLLCKDKDREVVEYALNRSLSPTMVSEYQTQLPNKELLQQKLQEFFESEESTD